MRKTGIYILLGITISLGIFIFTGVLYFRPEVQEPTVAKVVPSEETKKVTQPVEPVAEKPKVVQAPAPVKVAPEPVKVPEKPVEVPAPPRVPPVPSMRMSVSLYEAPEEVVVSEPVVEEVPPVEPVVEEAPPVEPVVEEAPPVEPVVEEAPPVETEARIVEEPSIEAAEMVVPVPEMEELPAKPEVAEEIAPKVVGEIPVEGEMEVEEMVGEPVKVTVEPEVYNIPVRRIPPQPTAAPTDVTKLLPQFTPSEPVEFIWTPVEVPKGPVQHVNPVSFNEQAFELRKKAVDELFDKLIWE